MAARNKKRIQKKAKPVIPERPTITLDKNPLRFSLIITSIFLCIALLGMLNHEMWRDEHQAWLVARDADSIPMLFQNMKYEGNPALWQFLLFIITRFTHNPGFMQALHLLIAGGFIFLFNRYAPFSHKLKILFSFSYFPLYEYAVISRNYGLGVLLLFAILVLYKNRTSYYIWIGILLALLSNISIYCVIISSGLAGMLVLDYFLYQQRDTKRMMRLAAGCLVFVAGTIFSLYQIWPEPDNSFPTFFADSPFDSFRWISTASKFFSTYFYIPHIEQHFWNSSIFFTDPEPGTYTGMMQFFDDHPAYVFTWLLLPALTLATGTVIFLRRPLVLFFYTSVTIVLCALFYYTVLTHVRYLGHLFTTLVASYWLSAYAQTRTYENKFLSTLSRMGDKFRNGFLTVILAFQVLGAIVAYTMDMQYVFSPSRQVAEYVKKEGLDHLPVAAVPDFIISPLATYFDSKLYYLQMEDWGSFCKWNSERIAEMNYRDWVTKLTVFMVNGRDSVLLIKNTAPQVTMDGINYRNMERAMISDSLQLDFLKYLEPGIEINERYFVYLVKKVDPSKIDKELYPRIN